MLDKISLQQIEDARRLGKKIGLVQGAWDLFHIGHLKYLLKARALCDFLVVAMDSDAKISKRKGSGRPVISQSERYDFIQLLGIADCIVIKDTNEPKWETIRTLRPDVLIAIKDNYSDVQIVELEEFCGKIEILPRQSKTSTSQQKKILTTSFLLTLQMVKHVTLTT